MTTFIEFENKPRLFADPLEVISCHNLSQIPVCFAKMEKALKSNYYLAGFLSYEAGYAFEESLKKKDRFDFPLIYFGVYKHPRNKYPRQDRLSGPKTGTALKQVKFQAINTSKADYFKSIRRIKTHIEQGDVYQITYCLKFDFAFDGDTRALYRDLKDQQPVPYPAYIETPDFSILSLSPEMFLKKTGDRIVTKPMKGTWPRGQNFWADLWAGQRLRFDPKNRAENVMIADLLRNDLGRIGSDVRTPRLFEVARYKTLYQMTSTVTAKVDPNVGLHEIFRVLHPSGSVTGAPKIRAMEIIRQIETEERQIYTGAIGYITPQRDMFFNVPIRTLLIRNGRGEMGVGGGIVWDSTPEGEWAEGSLKAKFLFDQDLGSILSAGAS